MLPPTNPPSTPLDICVPSALGFVECPLGHTKFTGNILTAGANNFSAAIPDPYWALGFSSLGNSYPFQTNIEQAYFYTTLQVFPTDLPQLSSTKVQFNDAYATPSGLVQTKWTINFDHANKIITVSDLMTKLPSQSGFRACSEIYLNFWRLDSFSYVVPPQTILLPYT
jgi:hypothetical protein